MQQSRSSRKKKRLWSSTSTSTAGWRATAVIQHASAAAAVLACTLLVLVLAAGADAQPVGNNSTATLPADTAAVTSLWQGLSPYEGSVLEGWAQTDPDPCAGAWSGVICSCDDLPTRAMAAACQGVLGNSSAGPRRVLGLDLGPMAATRGQKLSGTIHQALSELTELFYLDLSSNELTGTLPDISGLRRLQWLLLDDNQLSGPLPTYLGALPNLKQAQLQGNNFSGPVPDGWCAGQAAYEVSHNPYLCGSLPRCFDQTWRVSDVSGTYISNILNSGSGGACDDTQPDCDADVSCVIWTPKFWTSRSLVNFNFTGFLDYESGIQRYQWGIGSKPNTADVVPLINVTSGRVLKDIRYTGGTQKMFVTPVVYNLASVSLLDGRSYYVTVVAWNGAGPPMSFNASSQAVLVDTTGPVAGSIYNTYTHQQAFTTTATQTLQASWDNFTDPQSDVTGYIVQFFEVADSQNGSKVTQLTVPLAVGASETKLQVKASTTLPEGTVYIAQVTATNGAGLTTTAQALPITVKKARDGTLSLSYAALMGILCSLGCLVIGAALAVYWMKNRVQQQKKRDKRRAEDAKQLKALMYALSSQGDLPGGHNGSVSMPQARRVGDMSEQEVAFVFTDIESSTELSQQDADAFKQVQEVHDQLMREGIAKHGGYEITTEGDSFQVAFTSCHAAMAFCLDIQYRLLEQTWPKQVLALNACKIIRDSDGRALFAGPRVRMGLHWAREGTVAMRFHNLTRHKVFAGPAIQITMDVSEAANGGQILLTEDAVLKLTEDMSQAGFPVIRLLGLFQLPSVPSPVFLFSVTEVVGKPLSRQFTSLRKIKQVWPTSTAKLPPVLEFNINMPPLPNASGSLVFVCLRLCTYPKNKNCDLPKTLAAKFEEVFATSAQQFKGYLFKAHENAFKEGIWTVAFHTSMDALRFSHAAQMLLMYVNWPDNIKDYFGQEIPSPDGRWLFMGPRVCMAIHESPEFFVSDDPSVEPTAPRRAMCFAGPAVTLPLVLTYAGRGGQVILSEQAWDSVKPVITQHPGAVSIISLGMHVLSDDFPTPMLLMEVMPNLLARRNFNKIMTKRLVEPGFREAPDPREPMTVVFVKVAKPEEVVAAEKGAGGVEVCDAQISMTIQAYQLAVAKYASLARKLLRRYNGYECKEPEPGKFTLAFRDLADAIRWACHVQEEIMFLDWPEELLQMKGCGPEYDEDDNLIWRGLRLRIGMAHGMVSNQKPLNTGRADYFGVLPNAAARVMALATPGQVLIEASNPPLGDDGQLLLQQDNPTFLKLQYVPGSHSHHKARDLADAQAAKAASIEESDMSARMLCIHAVGYFLLRGLDNPRLMYSAESFRLQNRPLKIVQDMWAPPLGPFSTTAMNSSFASSRDSLYRNWGTWVERTKTSWIGKRLSPRNSTSPTSVDLLSGFSVAAKKGSVFNVHSPTGLSSIGHAPFSSGLLGMRTAAAAEGPNGTVRSRSMLSAGNSSTLGFGRSPRGAVSEAGRLGTGCAVNFVAGPLPDAARIASVGSYGSSYCQGRSSSPRPFFSSQSESAAAGRGLPTADRLAALLPASSSTTAGTVIVDAVGQSEDDEPGDTPAAARIRAAAAFASERAPRSAAWLLGSAGGADAGLYAASVSRTAQQQATPAGTQAPAMVVPVHTAAAAAVQLHSSVQGSEGLGVNPAVGADAGLLQDPVMTDPLLGCVHIPPIHTAAAPDSLWADSPGHLSLANASPGNLSAPVQAEHQTGSQAPACASKSSLPEQTGHGSSGGHVPLYPPSVDPSASTECLQPWQQQLETWHERQQWQAGDLRLDVGASSANGGLGLPYLASTPASLSTTMTSCVDIDDPSSCAQAQQQQAVARMQRMLSDRGESEASMSFSGAPAGMKGFLAGVAGKRPRLSGGSGGGAFRLFRNPQRLLSKVLRRHSTGSALTAGGMMHPGELGGIGINYPSDDEESVDKQVEAVQQQHGMVPHASSPNSSLSHTPCSSAPGSRMGTGGGAEALVSPGTVWARDVAQTWVNLHHTSSTSIQSQLPISLGGVDGGGLACTSSTQLAAAGLTTESSLGSQSFSHSASRGGSYTYADSSYSPTHCRPSVHLNPLAVWQQHCHQQLQRPGSSAHQQQQQQQREEQQATQLLGRPELSLREQQDSSTAAAAAAAVAAVDGETIVYDPAAVQPLQHGQLDMCELNPEQQEQQQQLFMEQQQGSTSDEAQLVGRAASQSAKHAQQDAVAQRLSQSMWASEDGRRQLSEDAQQQVQQQQLDDDLVQIMQQEMLSAQQRQQRQGQHVAHAGRSYIDSTLEVMSYRPDMPGIAVRAAASSGASFCAGSTAGHGSVDADCLQQTQGIAPSGEQHGKLLTPRAALVEQLQQARQSGGAVYTANEYRDLILQQRRERESRFTGHAAPAGLQLSYPDVRMQQQQPQQQHARPLEPALSQAATTMLVQDEPHLLAHGRQQQQGSVSSALAQPLPLLSQQQQQAGQEGRCQQAQPVSRPSPLGKMAKGGQPVVGLSTAPTGKCMSSSRGACTAVSAAGGSSNGAAAVELRAAAVMRTDGVQLETANSPCLQEHQWVSGAAGLGGEQAVLHSLAARQLTAQGLPVSPRMGTADAKTLAGRAAADVRSRSPRASAAAAARAVLSSGRGAAPTLTTSALFAAAPCSPVKRPTAAGGDEGQAAAAELFAGDSGTCSSGNNSPRFAQAASTLLGFPAAAAPAPSVHSLAGSSAQNSPRSSLPTTPRSISQQRSSLGGASFGAAFAIGSPVASAAPVQRAGSYNCSLGSPRCGRSSPSMSALRAAMSAAGDAGDSDPEDCEDDCDSGGLLVGHALLPGRRTPSCNVSVTKELPLVPITELPMMEGRLSDSSKP